MVGVNLHEEFMEAVFELWPEHYNVSRRHRSPTVIVESIYYVIAYYVIHTVLSECRGNSEFRW